MKTAEEVLLNVSRLVEEVDDIAELDLNPVFTMPLGQDAVLPMRESGRPRRDGSG